MTSDDEPREIPAELSDSTVQGNDDAQPHDSARAKASPLSAREADAIVGTRPASSRLTDEEKAEAERIFAGLAPEEDEDQVDRSVIMAEGVRSLAMWSVRLLVIAAAVFVSWLVIRKFAEGLLPITIAIIVCTVLSPVTSWLRSRGVPSGLAAVVSVLGFFGVIGAILWMITPNIVSQTKVMYLQAFDGIQRLQVWTLGPPLNLDNDDVSNLVNEAAAWLQDRAGKIATEVFSGLGTLSSIVVNLFVITVLTIFFLKDGDRFLPWVRSVAGRKIGWHLTELLTRVWISLGGYIRAQAAVSVIDALFIGTGLFFIGVPLTFALSIITFLAGFIPFVGAIVAGGLAVIVALVSLGITKAFLVLALVIAVQQLDGNIISPWMQSKAMDLHPVVILFSVIVGGGLFGMVGAFLAVPVASTIAVIFRYLQDIASIQTGEKEASEIEFATLAGALSGQRGEESGRAWRQRLRSAAHEDSAVHKEHNDARGSRILSDSPLADAPANDAGQHPSSDSPLATWRKKGAKQIEKAFHTFRHG